MLKAAQVQSTLRRGASARRSDTHTGPARFKPGETVIARNINPCAHTRIPRYVRGRQGTIDRDHGVFVYPDSHAGNGAQNPQHVYSVRFSARELWGESASASDYVYVDLWDDYLVKLDES